ncbi:hypothetical protein [Streptomyces tendae]|uniref:hypothetical protein n=1 Tax=Streptomyces tendae TaxID=1932 RepID=UPI003791A14B
MATHSTDFFARFAPVPDDDRLLAAALWVYWGFAFDDARCDSGPLSSRPAQFNALAGQVLGCWTPTTQRSRVVLPQPLGPSRVRRRGRGGG